MRKPESTSPPEQRVLAGELSEETLRQCIDDGVKYDVRPDGTLVRQGAGGQVEPVAQGIVDSCDLIEVICDALKKRATQPPAPSRQRAGAEMNLEDLARPLGLTASLDFRRKQGEPMTKPEQDAWNAVAELSRLVRNEALEEAARECHNQVAIAITIQARSGAQRCENAVRAMKSATGGKE